MDFNYLLPFLNYFFCIVGHSDVINVSQVFCRFTLIQCRNTAHGRQESCVSIPGAISRCTGCCSRGRWTVVCTLPPKELRKTH